MNASSQTTLPNSRGTDFDPDPDSPFTSRDGSYHEYTPLQESAEPNDPAVRNQHAKALRQIGLQVLSEARLTDPNVRYAREVLTARLNELRAERSLAGPDYDLIQEAFDLGVEHAALAVAAAWLRDRGSIPIPSE